MPKLLIILSVLLLEVSGCKKSDPGVRLLDAAESGDLVAVRSLIGQGVRINQPSRVKFGWTPLIGALFHNNTNIVQYLVESGADVNLPARNGETPLMFAISHGDDASQLVQYLLDHGANLDARDNAGLSAFDYVQSTPPSPRIVVILNAAREAKKKHP
jgi:ankyrin repeat protein